MLFVTFLMAAVREALKVCETLEAILKRTFGPSGIDVLLNSASGEILITNNGALILRSLSLETQIGRTIVDKVVSHCSITGDGSTSFILLLTALLRSINTHIDVRATIRVDEISPTLRESYLSLSKGFFKLESQLEEVIGPVFDKISINVDVKDDNISLTRPSITRLIFTALDGSFPGSIVNQLAELLSELVTRICNSSKSLNDSLLQIIDGFSQICIEVPGIPVSSSQITHGIVIPREFATELEKITSPAYKFVILNCSFDYSGPVASSTVQIWDQISLDANLQWKRNQLQKLISRFHKINVRLILSSENISDLALHFCRQHNIAVVNMIPPEFTQYISKSSGIIPIEHLDCDSLDDHFIGTGIFCGVQKVGQKKFVHLEVKLSSPDFIPHSLFLCSPMQGICKQYCIALHNALKCVKMCFSKDGKKLCFLPGSGATEFALSFNLKSLAAKMGDSNLLPAINLLSDALQAIPATLHQNSFSMQNQKDNFVYCLNEMERSLKNDDQLLGISSNSGKPVDPYKLSIFEPLFGKHLLLRSVLQCLSQLLRIDKFVSAKTAI